MLLLVACAACVGLTCTADIGSSETKSLQRVVGVDHGSLIRAAVGISSIACALVSVPTGERVVVLVALLDRVRDQRLS